MLGRADSYGDLLKLALGAGLGQDLVVQTPYGDSGQTTFFVATASDWDGTRSDLVGEDLKVMKRIDPQEAAIEGVITRHGTLVGPLMTELTGFPELTPYGGGWCGNDVFATALTERHRQLAREYTQRMGDRLRQEGYRGYFELDFLADVDSGELYLGELNPRVTGASSMTNVTAVAYGDMPLFLFHLLEFADVDYEIDVAALNEAWTHPGAVDEWSQFILKQTEDDVEVITHAPRSGIWRLDPGAHGGIRFVRRETDWHTVSSEDEAFYLRIAAEGQFRYPGADLGILVTRGRLQTDDHELTERALAWIRGIKAQFVGVPAPSRPSSRRRSRSPSRCCECRADIRGRRGGHARPEVAGALRAPLAALPAVVPARGRAGARVVRESARMLREHMPELVPTYECLCELAGGGDLEARMLSMWRPPSYLSGCSQAVWTRGEPILVRNYDYSPDRIEGTILATAWERSTRHRDERLPLGSPRRGQRRGARGLARVRRATVVGRRVRRPARRPLSAAGLRDGRRGARRSRSAPVPPRAHADPRRSRPATSSRRTSRPTAARSSATSASRRTTRATSSGTSTHGRRSRSSASGSSRSRSRRPHDPQSFADAFLRPPLFSAAYDSGMGTLYTAVYRPAPRLGRVPLAGVRMGALVRALPRGTAGRPPRRAHRCLMGDARRSSTRPKRGSRRSRSRSNIAWWDSQVDATEENARAAGARRARAVGRSRRP